MKKSITILCVLFSFIVLGVQAQGPDVLRMTKYFKDGYVNLLEKTLLPADEEGLTDLRYGRIWGFIYKPSFTPEKSLYCTVSDQTKLVLCEPDSSIWYMSSRQLEKRVDHGSYIRYEPTGLKWEDVVLDMKIVRHELPISVEQADVIEKLFAVCINTATSFMWASEHYSIETEADGRKTLKEFMGLDGEDFVFFQNGRSAECWSPYGGKLKRLTNIAIALMKAVRESDPTQLKALIPEAEALTREYCELLPDWAKEYFELKYK